MTQNYIIMQCYGHEGVFLECIMSLLSLSRVYEGQCPPATEIWLYTDNLDWFGKWQGHNLPIHFRTLDAATIADWRGGIGFVHRVKIAALIDFVQQRQGNILYADTDTIWQQPLEPLWASIGAGKLYMHVPEGIVSSRSNPIMAKLDTYLRANSQMQVHGKPLQDLQMWNAGILGFHTRHGALLSSVLAFTDTEYPRFPKHIIEQFGFSVFFQQAGPIYAAAPWVLHYWNLKEARAVIASFLQFFGHRPWAQVVCCSALVQLPVLMQEKANFLQNRSIWAKLQKENWQPQLPNWSQIQEPDSA